MRPARVFRPAGWLQAIVLVVAAASWGCRRSPGTSEPRALTPGVVTEVEVPGDKPIQVVASRIATGRVVVYLPPRCADPLGSFVPWAEPLADLATIVAVVGDRPCAGSPHFELGDAADVRRRVDGALGAVSARTRERMKEVVLAGYSQGAARAEELAALEPERFVRVLLVGAPTAPSATKLRRARAVATMAGERDRRDLMLIGTQELERVGVASRFFLLPGAAHGEVGPDGARVFRAALGWLVAQ